MSEANSFIDDRRARSNVLRLAIAQALAGANSVVIMTTGAIVGSMLAPSPVYATVPSLFMLWGRPAQH